MSDFNKYHRHYADGEIKPLFRGILHLICLFICPITILPLLYYCNSFLEFISILIYKLSVFTCLFFSSIFHIGNWSLETEKKLQMLDHAGIILVTTFSWAPIGCIYLFNTSFIYVVPIITIILFYYNGFISSEYRILCYLISGGIFINYIELIYLSLTFSEILFVILTFIQYLFALYIYNTKSFDFIPEIFGYHEVFHIFIVGGFITTYLTNLSVVIRSN